MKQEQIRITLIYNSISFLLIRIAIVNLLLITTAIFAAAGIFPKIPLFFLSIFLIIEIYIHFGIGKIKPSINVNENTGNAGKYESFTKEALFSILFKNNTQEFLNYVFKFPQARFILNKSAIDKKELVNKDVSLTDLANYAFELSRKQKGKYVTTADLLTSYLLITEPATKLLFNKELKEADLLNINKWSRVNIHEEEPLEKKARFAGIGFAETLVWGWTPETKKYTRDHTFSNVKKRVLINGREKEYNLLLETMQKPQNNNVLLVGEIGTGKSNLVENYIFQSYEAELPKKLNHRRFLELMIGPLIAGAAGREDLETRLQAVIDEVKHSVNVILYIPEFQNLLGSSSYKLDLSGAILPYLQDGKMPIVATMSKGEYKKYFENSALREVFEVIILEEPNFDDALKMLFQKTDEIENQNGVILSYSAVVAAVKYADKYEPSAVLPGTAVDLLNAVSNQVKIARGNKAIVMANDVTSAVEQKSKIPVGAPSQKEKTVLLNLENEMHKSVIGQDEAVSQVAEALRRIRAGIAREKPISFLFLGPTGVGKTETAKTLARLYFGGESHIIRVDMSEYGTSDGLNRLIQSGAQSFLDKVASHPFSLVLLDEFEKADSKILNLFLQVFDDGRMTDTNGRTISFTNTIIISTSNAGSEFIRESSAKKMELTNQELMDYLQKQGIFTPELLNRFDSVVTFKPLDITQIASVTQLVVQELAAKLAVQDIILFVSPQAVAKISKDGYSREFGARPLRRFVQDNIEDVIAKKILAGEIGRGDNILVGVDASNNFTFTKKTQ
jgi:ATP-dependent Clp protease ATP-binding subunit ClpA